MPSNTSHTQSSTKGNLIINKPQSPRPKGTITKVTTPEPPPTKRHNAPYCIIGNMISIGLTGSHSCRYMVLTLFFLFFLSSKSLSLDKDQELSTLPCLHPLISVGFTLLLVLRSHTLLQPFSSRQSYLISTMLPFFLQQVKGA